jgi:uroporphyrin-III C-methyltransferase
LTKNNGEKEGNLMGKVYIVGAGPGDPELLTIKGLRCIQIADVILYDRLINKKILEYAKEDADLIYCGKLPNFHTMRQETIHHFLIKYAKKGKVVVRLKGGDPFVFGRGGEEAEALAKNGIPFEVVPGITSGIAAPAYAGIPVTHREFSSSFAIITGHRKAGSEEDTKWEHLAKGVDTLAIYMGIGNLSYIREQLLKHGKSKDTPAAIVQNGTWEGQKTVVSTLGNILETAKQHQMENPCMIIIGEVVRMREKIHWFEKVLSEQQSIVSEAL